MFGSSPSFAAIAASKVFKRENVNNILELGGGQGRDSLFFARKGFRIDVLDYSYSGITTINKKANILNLSQFITAKCHDVRKSLPFKDESFDSCFSHMLYCMALSNSDLENLNNEICRVLKSGGINIYTVRHTEDGDYKNGVHVGEDLYENDGFIVHFFSKDKVNQLAKGFKILEIESFEEGKFPRKLFLVKNKKL